MAKWRRFFTPGRPRIAWIAIVAITLAVSVMAQTRNWARLASDGIHDPTSPAAGVLQEPGDALLPLPPDVVGNQVNWVKALDDGVINPRTNILPETKVNILNTDILLKRTGEMPIVRFPHRQHTAWLDCSNCHDQLFERKAGATKINMLLILQGEKCGLCHGAVSFPLTECNRCHSVERKLGPLEAGQQ